MDAKPPLRKALALEPVEISRPDVAEARAASDDSSADANAQRDLRFTTSDEFLAKAAKEYQKGNVDQALWRRAEDRCGDDASLVIAAYLRARATALQLQHKQDERSQIQARGAGSKRAATDQNVEPDPHVEIVSTKFVGVRPRGLKSKLMYPAAAVAALVSVVVVVYLLVSPRGSESVRQPIMSAAVPSPNQSALQTPPRSEQPVVKSTSDATNQGDPRPTLEATVQQLKNVGKWNLLVLYAVEWTRREPDNAAAWNELSFGYGKLRQFGDALDAATKAVQLSPQDSLLWRNLAHVDLATDRLPEAAIAFDKALALSSDNVDALCGAAVVARRQGRSKDEDEITRRIKSVDGSCPRVTDGESTVVVIGGSAARKPAVSGGR
jgi:tetratricopeptide (TPR) repeat protein